MNKIFALMITLCAITPFNLFAQKNSNNTAVKKAPDWKQIISMKSTRQDVEAILGKGIDAPLQSFPRTLNTFDDMNIQVMYSDGVCSYDGRRDYNIADGTVIYLEIDFTPPVDFLKLGIDSKSIMEESRNKSTDSDYTFYDYENGFRATTDKGINIRELLVSPPSSFEYLRCTK